MNHLIQAEEEFWIAYHRIMVGAPNRKTGEESVIKDFCATPTAIILKYPRPVSEYLPQWRISA